MQIPVLIEPVGGNGFRAQSGVPFPLSVEGATREEALKKLREMIEGHLSPGAEVVSMEISPTQHPLAPFAGMYKDEPLVGEWMQAMAEYRRQVEEDPNY